MKTFCLKTVGFLVLQGILFWLVWNPDLPHENNYLAATIDKHRRLEHTRSPRIIFIGGSNLAFGLKSDLMENQLGRPVVNMALSATLGIPFMLNEVAAQVGRGDLVVLSFEYHLFSGEDYDLNLRQLLELRPASFEFVPWGKWKPFLTDYALPIVGGTLRCAVFTEGARSVELTDFGYRRRGFDRDGSYIAHYASLTNLAAAPPERLLFARVRIPPMTAAARAVIARFAQHCAERGARCVYTCPPHPSELLRPILSAIETNLVELAAIPHFRVLDQPQDETYPMTEFYDSDYHLTKAGAIGRTRKLIAELQPLLRSGPE